MYSKTTLTNEITHHKIQALRCQYPQLERNRSQAQYVGTEMPHWIKRHMRPWEARECAPRGFLFGPKGPCMFASFFLFRILGQPVSDGKRVTRTTPATGSPPRWTSEEKHLTTRKSFWRKKPATQGNPHITEVNEVNEEDRPREARRVLNTRTQSPHKKVHAQRVRRITTGRISHGNDPLMRHA